MTRSESQEVDRAIVSGGVQAQALPLKSLIEGLLFVADQPVRIEQLATVLECTVQAVEAALEELRLDCEHRGLRLQRKGQRLQMVTAPEIAEFVRRLLGLEQCARLSPAALETLAIVAYCQPVTRTRIDAVRGVNTDSVLRTLLNLGLIEEQGRLAQAGRPIIYGTTFEFLQLFGLGRLEELPSLDGREPAQAESGSPQADRP
jgi:segregation and condensation protein B